MVAAAFASTLTYAPGGGGSLTQSFGVNVSYAAISAGTIDVGVGTAIDTTIEIPFGGVNVEAQGVVIKNNTGIDIGIRLNDLPTVVAPATSASIYRLAPGGMWMHWAPKAAGSQKLTKAAFVVTKTVANPAPPAPPEAGTVEYIVLGS
ncbi:MAG: hypothetical protein IPK82_35860 [Polyangiaceae bacterium]|nr:hypothetical protein [Polyangiaceae bacterium]